VLYILALQEAGGTAMKLYDNFAAAHFDPNLWSVLAIADGATEFHLCQDMGVRMEQREGQLMLRLSSFRAAHDVFQELDNRKYYLMSTAQWEVASRSLDFNATLAACCSGNPDDCGHGSAGFGILALEQGCYYELRTNGFKVWSVAARVRLPGLIMEGHEVLDLLQLPVETEPFRRHQFGLVYHPLRKTMDFYVDRVRLHSHVIEGRGLDRVRVGFGLATHLPISNGRSSSCYGQGGEIRFGPCFVPDIDSAD
jgi:hypothetical protein